MTGANISRVFGLLFVIATVGAGLAQAAPVSDLSQGQTGVIEYASTSPTFYQLVTKAAAPSISITGTLTLPAGTAGKVPAMILAHHCSGITASVTNLAALLNGMGIATFIPDSFTPRGYPSGVCSNASTVSHGSATADVLNALKLLATHPRIDSNRIGVIGQSYGGNTVYNTAFEEVRKTIIGDSLKFATHIALYPGCEVRNWSPNMTGASMLILLGGADDWALASTCTDYSLLLRSLGPQITTIVYPNAPHAWDNPTGTVNYSATRGSYVNCRLQFRLDTLQSSRFDTGAALGGTATTDYLSSCFKTGATQGRDDATKIASDRDITLFLAKVFNLSGVTLPASQPDRIFNYLEVTYPQHIAPAGTASQTNQGYYYRYYANTNSYIATSGGKLFFYAPNISPSILFLGDEATFLNLAGQAGH